MPDALKETINGLFNPTIFVCVGTILFFLAIIFYRVWTKPVAALAIAIVFTSGLLISMTDKNFFIIVSKPDNVPIIGLIYLVGFFTWLSLRQAAINDERLEKGLPPREAEETNDRVLVWPDLVYIELISMIILTVVLIIWSIELKAPLEDPANPAATPNPSKAPWYFLGLQEMLVYFDPWIAGVVLPSLIISGLIIIPFVDKNPKGVGYYTLKERPFAITTYLFGFIVLWVLLIIMGTFFRGPNWNFFGPYEYWDVHKAPSLANVDLSEYFWVKWLGIARPANILLRELPGFVLVIGYFLVLPPLLAGTVFKKIYKQIGFMRYNLLIMHLIVMLSMIIKMVARWGFNLKYVVSIPEYFFNI